MYRFAACFLFFCGLVLLATLAKQDSQREAPDSAHQPKPRLVALTDARPAQIHNAGTDLNGDPLPTGAIARIGSLRLRHDGEVYSLACSPDRKTVASCGNDDWVRLWDVTTGKELRAWRLRDGYNSSVAFSPDGQTLAAVSRDGTIVFWDPASGEEIDRLHNLVQLPFWTAVSFSPDGKLLAVATGQLCVWDIARGRRIAVLQGDDIKGRGDIRSLAFAPDGKALAFATTEEAGVCDPRTGKVIRKLPGSMAVAYSGDGTHLAVATHLTGADNEFKVKILSTATGKIVHEGQGSYHPWIALSQDGKTLVCASGQHDLLYLVDIRTKEELWLGTGKAHYMSGFHALTFSPDGKTVATAGRDGGIRFWDRGSREEKSPPAIRERGAASASLLADGKTLVALGEGGRIRLWETATGKPILRLAYDVPYKDTVMNKDGPSTAWLTKDMPVSCISLSRDGKTLAAGCEDGPVLIWDLAKRQFLKRLEPPGDQNHEPQFVVLSPDARTLAIQWPGVVYVRDVASNRTLWKIPSERWGSVVQFSPDSRSLLTGGEEGIMHVWDTATGKERHHWRPHGGEAIFGIAFSDDSKLLASVGRDDFVALWNAQDFNRLRRFHRDPDSMYVNGCVAFSHDGKLVAAGERRNGFSIWEIDKGTQWRVQGHRSIVNSLSFTPDDALVISGSSDSTALVWNLAQLKKMPQPGDTEPQQSGITDRPLPPGAKMRLGSAYFQGENGLGAVALSPNGKTIAVTLYEKEGFALSLWEVASGKRLRTLSKSAVAAHRFSPDGRILAGQAGNSVVLVDAATGERLQQFVVHPDHLSRLAFSPDGKVLATGGWYYGQVKDSPISLWDVATAQPIARLSGPRTQVGELGFSADGRWLGCCTFSPNIEDPKGIYPRHGEIFVWELKTGKLVRQLPHPKWSGQVLVNGTLLASADEQAICLRDLLDGKTHFRLRGEFSSWLFSPDAKLLATVGKDNVLRFWDVASGKERHQVQVPCQPHSFSADGSTLAVACGNSVRFWNTATFAEMGPHSGHQGDITCLAYAPDGKWLVSGSGDRTLRLWDVKSGKELGVYSGHTANITSVAVSPDGRRVASGDDHNTVCFWDAVTSRVLFQIARPMTDPFNHRPIGIVGVDFTRDGKGLIAGSADGTIRIWDTATGKESRSFRGLQGTLQALALSPGGDVLACATKHPGSSEDAGIYLLDMVSGKELQTVTVSISEKQGDRNFGDSTIVFRRLQFSPDGKVLAASNGRVDHFHGHWLSHEVRLWETATGKEIEAIEASSQVGGIAFSNDGKTLAFEDSGLGERGDETIQLWDMTGGRKLGRLWRHTGWVNALAFSPDGSALASGGTDHFILLWDTCWSAFKRKEGREPAVREAAELWTALGSADAAVAYDALRQLRRMPGQAVLFLEEHLRPISSADWAQFKQWIAGLDDAQFTVRQLATRELEKLGGLAEPLLSEALTKKPSLEVCQRIAALQERLRRRGPPLERLRMIRAITVLEWIGSAEAQRVLKKLASGAPAAPETSDAQAALSRLAVGHKGPAAPPR